MKRQILAIDAGLERLALIDTANPRYGWTRSLARYPGARDIQRIGQNLALLSCDQGCFEVVISSGEISSGARRWSRIASAFQLPNGATLLAGLNDEGLVQLITLDREYRQVGTLTRRTPAAPATDYLGAVRPTPLGGYLLCLRDHVLETDAALVTLRTLRAPGFDQVWHAQRLADGSTLASAGAGAFIARFDSRGYLAATFGAPAQLPPSLMSTTAFAAAPCFYAGFQLLADGSIIIANRGGGHALVELQADGRYRSSWAAPDPASALQALLVL